MKKIEIEASNKYDYCIERGFVDSVGEVLRKTVGNRGIIVVSDDTVDSLYGNRVAVSLIKSGYNPLSYVLEDGEKSKNFTILSNLLEFMAENHVTRNDIILALGGGVVGDIAGFAAAIYLRGIDYIQFPTTFLAAIDSAVGGKTAVNLKAGKNLAGAIYQPLMVLCDPDTFDTLEPEVFADGTAEAIKCGLIADKRMFSRLSKATFRKNVEDIIEGCVKIKANIVKQDEFGTGQRQLLNLGHTFAYSIEKCSDYSISHGSAVGMGLMMASKAAVERGLCKPDLPEKINEALIRNGLRTKCRISPEKIVEGMLTDKKRGSDYINMVFPRKVGRCEIIKVYIDEIEDIVKDGLKPDNLAKTGSESGKNGMESERIKIIENAMAQHVLLAAALSDKETIFKMNDDTSYETMIECLKELGVETEIRNGGLCKVTPISMNKNEDKGGFLPIINCQDDGTCLRLLVPVIAALQMVVFVSGTGELAKTPFNDMIEAMEPKGSIFRFDHFPFELSGKLTAGEFSFESDVSKEFLSGLLMALPILEGDSRIIINGELKDEEYINKTLRVLREFGIEVEKNSNGFVVKGGQRYVSPAGFELYDLV